MVLYLILGLASIFALFWTWKTKKLVPAIITVGMIIGIFLTISKSESLKDFGLYLYMGFTTIAFIYGLFFKKKKLIFRIVVCLIAASIFLYWLWVQNHWHGNTLLIPIFTLLIFSIALISKVKMKNELGFIVILIADAVAIIIENLMKL